MKRTCDSSSGDDISDDDLGKKYLSKISIMMYTFGDVKEPLEKSVKLMYIILREQMTLLLIEAEAAKLHNSDEISHREILFLMRKNKAKLRHLLHYIQILDSKPWFTAIKQANDDGSSIKMKRFEMCMDFLATIEDCGEFTSLLEDETLILPEYAKKRLERRILMIDAMEKNEYDEFSKALQVSFYQSENEFLEWLEQEVTDFRLTPLAIRIISFLARETIAEVVDKVLLIRSNKLEGVPCYNNLDIFRMKMNVKHQVHAVEYLTNISEKEVHILCNTRKIVHEEEIKNINSENHLESPNNFNDDNIELPSNTSSTKKIEFFSTEDDNTFNVIDHSETVEYDAGESSSTNSTENSDSNGSENYMRNSDFNENENSTKQFDSNEYENSTKQFDSIEYENSTRNSDSNGSEYVCVEDSDNAEQSMDDVPDSVKRSEESSSHSKSPKYLFSYTSNISDDEQTYQKTEGGPNAYPAIEDVSDSDIENTKNTNENREKLNSTSIDNGPEMSKKEFLCRKAITQEEIREAVAQFNRPSPLAYFFSNHPVRLKKKFCLAESFEDF